MIFEKMDKCPRCNLPQKGTYKCQYCGYDLKEYNKKTTIRIYKKLRAIIGEFKASRILTNDKKRKVLSMNNPGKAYKRTDEWGSRSGTDRRKHQYAISFPERRSGSDRRK